MTTAVTTAASTAASTAAAGVRRVSVLAVVLAVLATALTAGLTAIAPPAMACSCAGPATIRDYARWSEDVVVARVGAIEEVGRRLEAKARVRRVYQGRARTHLTVVTERDGASCGLRLRSGQLWIFFTDARRPGRATVSLCAGNRFATERNRQAVARVLGPGTPKP